jgi:hypothetical protein
VATTTVKPLGQGKPAYNTTTILYTAPNVATGGAILKELLVCNTNGTDGTFTAYKVANAGSPSASNAIVSALTVKAGDTFVFSSSTVLGQNETLRVVSLTSGADLTFTASGVEFQ